METSWHPVADVHAAPGLDLRQLAVLALSWALAACGGGGGSSDADASALAQRTETPAPAASCSYQHLYVTVERVRVRSRTGAAEQWADITLATPQRIDLLNVSGGVLRALSAAPLAPGDYTEVRLVLASNEDGVALANAVQPTGGALASLTVPSGEQSGLKLKGDFVVLAGQSGDIVLPGFDPCDAVVQVGKPGSARYHLKPEIAAGLQLMAATPPETRFISGNVIALIGGGYALWRLEGSTIVLQRYGADGQVVGAAVNITGPFGSGLSVAPLAGGGYAAVWVTPLGGAVYQLYVQSFTVTGTPLGSPLPLAQVSPGAVSRPPAVPQVAPLAGGGFVVVWGLQQSVGSTVFDTGVYAQRFNPNGTPASPAQLVAAEGTGHLGVVGTASGGYLISWGTLTGAQGGVRAYSPGDVALGPAQSAGSSWAPSGSLASPPGAIARLAGGGAVLVWQSLPFTHLLVQQIGPDGTPLAARVVDDATVSPTYTNSTVGALADGGYVVAWALLGGGDVYARRYAADGTPVGGQTRVNVLTTLGGDPLAVVALAGGGFMISWSGVGTDGVRSPYSRTFSATGLLGAP